MDNFGARLTSLREERRLTRPDMAAVLGVSMPMLRGWERNVSNPPLAALTAIADAFDVSLHWLLLGEGPRSRAAVRSTVETDASIESLAQQVLHLANRVPFETWQQGMLERRQIEVGLWIGTEQERRAASSPDTPVRVRVDAMFRLNQIKKDTGIDLLDEATLKRIDETRSMMGMTGRLVDVVEPPVQRPGHVEQVVRTFEVVDEAKPTEASKTKPKTEPKRKRG